MEEVEKLSGEALVRHGLKVLARYPLTLAKERKHIFRWPLQLDRHPFRLPLVVTPSSWLGRIEFMDGHGCTEFSVYNMLHFLSERLFSTGWPGNQVNYLRVILAEVDRRFPDHHYVYFEVGLPSTVLMCNGCTDYSGEGGRGKRDLDAVFALLSQFYGVEIQTVTVPYPVAMEARDCIDTETRNRIDDEAKALALSSDCGYALPDGNEVLQKVLGVCGQCQSTNEAVFNPAFSQEDVDRCGDAAHYLMAEHRVSGVTGPLCGGKGTIPEAVVREK